MNPRCVKCRFCDWTQALYEVAETHGMEIGGWEELKLHVQLKHPAEARKLAAWLGPEKSESL